jgi:hypothetical protein
MKKVVKSTMCFVIGHPAYSAPNHVNGQLYMNGNAALRELVSRNVPRENAESMVRRAQQGEWAVSDGVEMVMREHTDFSPTFERVGDCMLVCSY